MNFKEGFQPCGGGGGGGRGNGIFAFVSWNYAKYLYLRPAKNGFTRLDHCGRNAPKINHK